MDLSKRCASSWVVNDLLDNPSQVAMSLRIIELAKCGRILIQTSIRRKDRSAALTLISDDATHRVVVLLWSSGLKKKDPEFERFGDILAETAVCVPSPNRVSALVFRTDHDLSRGPHHLVTLKEITPQLDLIFLRPSSVYCFGSLRVYCRAYGAIVHYAHQIAWGQVTPVFREQLSSVTRHNRFFCKLTIF